MSRGERRLAFILVLALICIGGVHYYLVGRTWPGAGAGRPDLSGVPESGSYRPLSDAERERSQRQRDLAAALARRHVGSELTGRDESDLRVLQDIVDRGVLKPDQTFELQALGVALGDVLAARLGLHWIAYEDAFGRNRALRLDETDVVLFPVTMISKRVEAGVDVSVRELFEKARRAVEAGRGRPPGSPQASDQGSPA